jgi:ornithine carbamoyltransferase
MTTGVEVTGGVLESAASVVFGQAETARTIKAILVATLG